METLQKYSKPHTLLICVCMRATQRMINFEKRETSNVFRVQELCESRGGLPVPNKPAVSVDVKQYVN